MIAYLDASVILRRVLGQADSLNEWPQLVQGVASALAETECLRTLDRLRLTESLTDSSIATRREAVYRLMEAIEVIDISAAVLTRAAQPLPTTLGTLDAIHLASAMLWQERSGQALVLATHDRALATAARASGLFVIGVH